MLYLPRMFQSITVRAPAKINIGLQVLPGRSDGYHGIRSIFTTVGLYDTLTVTRTDRQGCCTVECGQMALPPDNTFTRTYKAFCVLTGTDCGIHVTVEKRIPSGGGLGGGSSDASSFLQSIDTLCGTSLSAPAFRDIAGQVGSDVFFFTEALLAGGAPFAAYVSGRGEHVQPVPPRTDLPVVLVFPGVSVSTADAYRWVDESRAGAACAPQLPGAMDAYAAGFASPAEEWAFRNDFTAPVVARFPRIGKALAAVKECGAEFADMSGSGSTVFGVFETEKKALLAAGRLSEEWRAVPAFGG